MKLLDAPAFHHPPLECPLRLCRQFHVARRDDLCVDMLQSVLYVVLLRLHDIAKATVQLVGHGTS